MLHNTIAPKTSSLKTIDDTARAVACVAFRKAFAMTHDLSESAGLSFEVEKRFRGCEGRTADGELINEPIAWANTVVANYYSGLARDRIREQRHLHQYAIERTVWRGHDSRRVENEEDQELLRKKFAVLAQRGLIEIVPDSRLRSVLTDYWLGNIDGKQAAALLGFADRQLIYNRVSKTATQLYMWVLAHLEPEEREIWARFARKKIRQLA